MDLPCGTLIVLLLLCTYIFYQGLKAATIDQVPEALRIPKRRDCEPLPPASGPQAVTKAPSHVENTRTNNAAVVNSQSYLPSHPGFANIQGFPSFPAPTFPTLLNASTNVYATIRISICTPGSTKWVSRTFYDAKLYTDAKLSDASTNLCTGAIWLSVFNATTSKSRC